MNADPTATIRIVDTGGKERYQDTDTQPVSTANRIDTHEIEKTG